MCIFLPFVCKEQETARNWRFSCSKNLTLYFLFQHPQQVFPLRWPDAPPLKTRCVPVPKKKLWVFGCNPPSPRSPRCRGRNIHRSQPQATCFRPHNLRHVGGVAGQHGRRLLLRICMDEVVVHIDSHPPRRYPGWPGADRQSRFRRTSHSARQLEWDAITKPSASFRRSRNVPSLAWRHPAQSPAAASAARPPAQLCQPILRIAACTGCQPVSSFHVSIPIRTPHRAYCSSRSNRFPTGSMPSTARNAKVLPAA